MVNASEIQVIQHLEQKKDKIIDNWVQKVITHTGDPYEDLIRLNGQAMFDLVIRSLRGNHIDDHQLKIIAHKISEERLTARIKISDYVYNISIGRSELLQNLPHTLSVNEIQRTIDKIDFCFNRFLYYTVEHYMELKDKELKDQSLFIEQTHKDHLTILGQMASSFIHEFRNPLTSVIGFIHLLWEKYPTLEYRDVLTKELEQLKYRINQFLLVSRKGMRKEERVRFHLGDLIEETLDFLYPMILSSQIVIEKRIDDTIYFNGRRDELRQVLINIMMNSFDAVSENGTKKVRIHGHIEKTYGIVSISNNGPAIGQDIISSIFEPFVSSKKLGTGIGLYVCRKIVEEHLGTIDCESTPDCTSFRFAIPILAK